MKKLLSLLLLSCFLLTACGQGRAEPPSVSCEILREEGAGSSYAEYPAYSRSGAGYDALSAALEDLNRAWQEGARDFLAGGEPPRCQSVSASVTRCDSRAVCLVVTRTLEEGGPHPNTYSEAHVLDPATGEPLLLTDFLTVDAALSRTVQDLLYESYPELDFDRALVEREVDAALESPDLPWYFWEDQLCIGFPEGSFGFSHAEGSLGVLLPLPAEG